LLRSLPFAVHLIKVFGVDLEAAAPHKINFLLISRRPRLKIDFLLISGGWRPNIDTFLYIYRVVDLQCLVHLVLLLNGIVSLCG
jgi:hypothetical protein